MGTLRCPICLTSWPVDDQFQTCPGENCEFEDTDLISNVRPSMSLEDALVEKKRLDFDRFYEEWDASQDPDRLKVELEQDSSAVP